MPHINELVDWTVEVFIVYQNKVLLRFHDKYQIWLSVGGHVEPNENPNEAALREVREETGLEVKLSDKLLPFQEKTADYEELIPPYFLNIHKISETHRHISLTYFASAESDQIVEPDREKSGGWKWLTKDEIMAATDIKAYVKHYALKALEELHN
ncbi:NUDIX domain-containing protein [Patescibacteria group bacterium]|nr:MAG: NUDIX domain-containing protein [Patescibacteria group bacterium]